MLKWYEEVGSISDVVISSRIRLARNLKNHPFPPKLTKEQSEKMVRDLELKLNNFKDMSDREYHCVKTGELDSVDRVALAERHLLSEKLVTSNLYTGAVIAADESISVMMNEEDHIRIQAMASGMNLEKAWDMASEIDDAINEKFPYAFHEKLGYLTSFPTNVGTGLRASYLLHLPAMANTKKIAHLASDIGRFGITIQGLHTENETGLGNLFQIYNQNTLGASEEEIMRSLSTIANQIIKQERRMRAKILKENEMGITDTVYRSYGTLKYCRTLEIEEAVTLLSDVQFGISTDIIKMDDKDKMCVFSMLMGIQPAHLTKRAQKQLNDDERSVFRADYVRETLPECMKI